MKETPSQTIKRVLNESRLQRGRPRTTNIEENEEFEPSLQIINQLRKTPIHNMNVVMFKNGWKAAIPAAICEQALNVFEKLKPNQKLEYQTLIEESPDSFIRTLHLTEDDLILSDGPVDGSGGEGVGVRTQK